MNEKFLDAVMHLHEIARLVEQEIGSGLLSQDIRNAADRLHLVANPIKEVNEK